MLARTCEVGEKQMLFLNTAIFHLSAAWCWYHHIMMHFLCFCARINDLLLQDLVLYAALSDLMEAIICCWVQIIFLWKPSWQHWLIHQMFCWGNLGLTLYQECVKYMQEHENAWSSDLLHFHLSHYPIYITTLVVMTGLQLMKSMFREEKNLPFHG